MLDKHISINYQHMTNKESVISSLNHMGSSFDFDHHPYSLNDVLFIQMIFFIKYFLDFQQSWRCKQISMEINEFLHHSKLHFMWFDAIRAFYYWNPEIYL